MSTNTGPESLDKEFYEALHGNDSLLKAKLEGLDPEQKLRFIKTYKGHLSNYLSMGGIQNSFENVIDLLLDGLSDNQKYDYLLFRSSDYDFDVISLAFLITNDFHSNTLLNIVNKIEDAELKAEMISGGSFSTICNVIVANNLQLCKDLISSLLEHLRASVINRQNDNGYNAYLISLNLPEPNEISPYLVENGAITDLNQLFDPQKIAHLHQIDMEKHYPILHGKLIQHFGISTAQAKKYLFDIADAIFDGYQKKEIILERLHALIQSGIDVNLANDEGETLLLRILKIEINSINISKFVEALALAGATLNKQDPELNEILAKELTKAIGESNISYIKTLIKLGADVNAPFNDYGYTSLTFAIANNSPPECIAILENAGGKLDLSEPVILNALRDGLLYTDNSTDFTHKFNLYVRFDIVNRKNTLIAGCLENRHLIEKLITAGISIDPGVIEIKMALSKPEVNVCLNEVLLDAIFNRNQLIIIALLNVGIKLDLSQVETLEFVTNKIKQTLRNNTIVNRKSAIEQIKLFISFDTGIGGGKLVANFLKEASQEFIEDLVNAELPIDSSLPEVKIALNKSLLRSIASNDQHSIQALVNAGAKIDFSESYMVDIAAAKLSESHKNVSYYGVLEVANATIEMLKRYMVYDTGNAGGQLVTKLLQSASDFKDLELIERLLKVDLPIDIISEVKTVLSQPKIYGELCKLLIKSISKEDENLIKILQQAGVALDLSQPNTVQSVMSALQPILNKRDKVSSSVRLIKQYLENSRESGDFLLAAILKVDKGFVCEALINEGIPINSAIPEINKALLVLLIRAISLNDRNNIEALVSIGVTLDLSQVTVVDSVWQLFRTTIIGHLAREEYVKTVEQLKRFLAFDRGHGSEALIAKLFKEGNPQFIEVLINSDMTINFSLPDIRIAATRLLDDAFNTQNVNLLRLLILRAGADIVPSLNQFIQDRNPVNQASNLINLRFLSQAGVEVNTPIYYSWEATDDIQLLITQLEEQTPFPRMLAAELNELLIHAIHLNKPVAVKRLIELGANVTLPDRFQWTPLHHAAYLGDPGIIKLLRSYGASANRAAHADPDAMATYPMHLAVQQGHIEAVHELAFQIPGSNGGDVNQLDEKSMKPIHYAAKSGFVPMIIQMIYIEKLQDMPREEWPHAYERALVNPHSQQIIAKFAKLNDDLNPTRKSTLLHLALEGGHEEMIKLLISLNAQLNARNHDNLTPLDMAVRSGRIEWVKMLVQAGAELNPMIQAGTVNSAKNPMTPLSHAVVSGSPEMVNCLIALGARPELQDHLGNTALHIAIKHGAISNTLPCIDTLCTLKPTDGAVSLLQIENNHGETPRQLALASLNKDMIMRAVLIDINNLIHNSQLFSMDTHTILPEIKYPINIDSLIEELESSEDPQKNFAAGIILEGRVEIRNAYLFSDTEDTRPRAVQSYLKAYNTYKNEGEQIPYELEHILWEHKIHSTDPRISIPQNIVPSQHSFRRQMIHQGKNKSSRLSEGSEEISPTAQQGSAKLSEDTGENPPPKPKI